MTLNPRHRDPRHSMIDHTGSEKSYGWTKDADGIVWYWNVPLEGGKVSFRDWGYPVDHPMKKTGTVPDDVREHAQTHVDALMEQNELEWY